MPSEATRLHSGFHARSVVWLSVTFEHGMTFPQIISPQANKPVIDIVQDSVASKAGLPEGFLHQHPACVGQQSVTVEGHRISFG